MNIKRQFFDGNNIGQSLIHTETPDLEMLIQLTVDSTSGTLETIKKKLSQGLPKEDLEQNRLPLEDACVQQ